MPSLDERKRFATKPDQGAGEPLKDDTFNSPLQPTHVKTGSVVLKIPVTFTQTGQQDCPPASYEVSTSPQPSSGPVTAACFTYDGNVGAYSARPELCLPSSHHASLNEVKDINGKPIKCTTANGVQGNNGYWYDLGKGWSHVFLRGNQLGKTGVLKTTLSIPVDLPVAVNSVRVEIKLGLKDTAAPSSPYIQTMWGEQLIPGSQNPSQFTPVGGPELVVTRFAIQLPNITVLPAVFTQINAIPYTIIYRPPGDKSVSTFSTTQSFGTTMTTAGTTSIDNTTSFMQSMGLKEQLVDQRADRRGPGGRQPDVISEPWFGRQWNRGDGVGHD